jgi:hypothetical protein
MVGTCIAVLVALVEAVVADDEDSDSSEHNDRAEPDRPEILGGQQPHSASAQISGPCNRPGGPDWNDRPVGGERPSSVSSSTRRSTQPFPSPSLSAVLRRPHPTVAPIERASLELQSLPSSSSRVSLEGRPQRRHSLQALPSSHYDEAYWSSSRCH